MGHYDGTFTVWVWPPLQVCGVLRALDTDSQRLRDYIDQLLAKVLERNPGILEGMPRSQLTRGLQLDMLRGAAIPEVLHTLAVITWLLYNTCFSISFYCKHVYRDVHTPML